MWGTVQLGRHHSVSGSSNTVVSILTRQHRFLSAAFRFRVITAMTIQCIFFRFCSQYVACRPIFRALAKRTRN